MLTAQYKTACFLDNQKQRFSIQFEARSSSDGKITFAPLDVMFFVFPSLISIVREEKLAPPPIENR